MSDMKTVLFKVERQETWYPECEVPAHLDDDEVLDYIHEECPDKVFDEMHNNCTLNTDISVEIQNDTHLTAKQMENKTAKTELSRDDLKAILKVYNKLDRIATNVHEILDMDLSQLRDMERNLYDLRELFKFRPVKGEDGNPDHYKPSVLPDDPTAWYYKEEAA